MNMNHQKQHKKDNIKYNHKLKKKLGEQCQICSWNVMLELHHIFPYGDRSKIGNSILLCVNCHNDLHKFIRDRKNGYLGETKCIAGRKIETEEEYRQVFIEWLESVKSLKINPEFIDIRLKHLVWLKSLNSNFEGSTMRYKPCRACL